MYCRGVCVSLGLYSLFGCCYDVNLEIPPPPSSLAKTWRSPHFHCLPSLPFLLKIPPWGLWSLHWHSHGFPWYIEVESTFPLKFSSAACRHSIESRDKAAQPAGAHIYSPLGCQKDGERDPCLRFTAFVLTQTFLNSLFSFLLTVKKYVTFDPVKQHYVRFKLVY